MSLILLTLKINNQEITVESGTTILEAAKKLGIEIPHFCYHPKLTLSGTCRLCLVEIEKNPKLQTSCSTTVTDGMIVWTESEKVVKARQGILEFFLINHPLDCSICDQAGECKLQDYAFKYGASESRFEETKRTYPIVKIGETLVRNMNRCVHCRRCIRFCKEIAGADEYGVFERSAKSDITIFPNKPVQNPYSGNMADICPVGALTSVDFRFKARVWNLKTTESICTSCSTGCNIYIHTKENKVFRILPRTNEEINECWICDEGRWGYHHLNDSENRLYTTRLKDKPDVSLLPLDSACELVANELKKIKDKYGSDSIGGIISAQCTNEEMAAFKKLFVEVVGSKRLDFTLNGKYVDPSEKVDFLRKADKNPNTKGALELGIKSSLYDNDTNSMLSDIEKQNIKALFIVSCGMLKKVPLDEKLKNILNMLELLIVQDYQNSEISNYLANIVLPGVTFAEKTGTFTNFKGIKQKINPSLKLSEKMAEDVEIINKIAKQIG